MIFGYQGIDNNPPLRSENLENRRGFLFFWDLDLGKKSDLAAKKYVFERFPLWKRPFYPKNFPARLRRAFFFNFPLVYRGKIFLALKVHFLLVFPCKITRFSKNFRASRKNKRGFLFFWDFDLGKNRRGFLFFWKISGKIAGGFYLRGGIFNSPVPYRILYP